MLKHSYILIILLFLISPILPQVTVGDSAINFALPDTNDTIISLQDFSGDIIILNFFAHWCAPCYVEAPMLEDSIWQAYNNQGVTVLGVGYNQSISNIRFFTDSTHVTYPLLRDTLATVFNEYGVPFLPYNFIINQNGYVAHSDGVQGFDIQLMVHIVDSLLTATSIKSNENPSKIAENLELLSAYPNPFNNQVNIKFEIKSIGPLELEIFDITGKRIIRENIQFAVGTHTISIDMSSYSSGIYFYKLQQIEDKEIGRFILQK